MSDRESDNKILDLRADFPAVPTEAWEAAIRTDLRGADYDKKLVWKSEEGSRCGLITGRSPSKS